MEANGPCLRKMPAAHILIYVKLVIMMLRIVILMLVMVACDGVGDDGNETDNCRARDDNTTKQPNNARLDERHRQGTAYDGGYHPATCDIR